MRTLLAHVSPVALIGAFFIAQHGFGYEPTSGTATDGMQDQNLEGGLIPCEFNFLGTEKYLDMDSTFASGGAPPDVAEAITKMHDQMKKKVADFCTLQENKQVHARDVICRVKPGDPKDIVIVDRRLGERLDETLQRLAGYKEERRFKDGGVGFYDGKTYAKDELISVRSDVKVDEKIPNYGLWCLMECSGKVESPLSEAKFEKTEEFANFLPPNFCSDFKTEALAVGDCHLEDDTDSWYVRLDFPGKWKKQGDVVRKNGTKDDRDVQGLRTYVRYNWIYQNWERVHDGTCAEKINAKYSEAQQKELCEREILKEHSNSFIQTPSGICDFIP